MGVDSHITHVRVRSDDVVVEVSDFVLRAQSAANINAGAIFKDGDSIGDGTGSSPLDLGRVSEFSFFDLGFGGV